MWVVCLFVCTLYQRHGRRMPPTKSVGAFIFTLYDITGYKRIAFISAWTTAHRYMVDHFTYCITGTCIWTRVHTFLAHTYLGSLTVRTHCTFWSTPDIWISVIFRQTRAFSVVAFRVRSTRRWIA